MRVRCSPYGSEEGAGEADPGCFPRLHGGWRLAAGWIGDGDLGRLAHHRSTGVCGSGSAGGLGWGVRSEEAGEE